MNRSYRPRVLIALLLGGALVGCSDQPTGAATESGPPAGESWWGASQTVEISPSNPTVAVGDSLQLKAVVRDRYGRVVWGAKVRWLALPFTISENGLLYDIHKEGTGKVRAESEGGASEITVKVVAPAPEPAPVARVTVSPDPVSILTGGTAQLTATLRDASGNVLTGRAVTWFSANTSVANVSASGLVTGYTAGATRVVGASEGRADTVSVTVSAPAPAPVASVTVSPSTSSLTTGETVQLAVALRDGSGNVLSGRTVTWSSSNTSVATVNGSGLVTAVGGGSATVRATSEGRSGSATIAVTAPSAPEPPPTQPGGSNVVFQSDWSHALGNSDAAQNDGGRWPYLVCPRSNVREHVLHVVPGSEAGWSLTPNVLRVTNRGSTRCGNVETTTQIPTNTSFFVRMYVRVEDENQMNWHPVTLNCCGSIQHVLWAIQNPSAGSSYQSPTGFRDASGTMRNWMSPVLQQRTWYRFEWHIEVVDAARRTFRVWPRVYDMAGRLLYDAESYRDRDRSSGATLAEYYRSGGLGQYSDANLFRRFGVGYEGNALARDEGRKWYYAAAQVCLDGWCGPR